MFRTDSHAELPSKLAREPLVDAIFEMRFDTDVPVSSIWPGILYGKLPGEKTMENLPALGIPKEIRASDPNLAYIHLTKLSWGNYWILIGDQVIAVASKLPYQGWDEFKSAIISTFEVVLNSGMINVVTRCSIKYIDILEGVPLQPSECFKLKLEVGGRSPAGSEFQARLSIAEGGVNHSLQVASQASITLHSGRIISGPLLDVDSVLDIELEPSDVFLSRLEERAHILHDSNKSIVFDCLSSEALAFLEPSYE